MKTILAKTNHRGRPRTFRLVNRFHGPKFEQIGGLGKWYAPSALIVVDAQANDPDCVRLVDEAKRRAASGK